MTARLRYVDTYIYWIEIVFEFLLDYSPFGPFRPLHCRAMWDAGWGGGAWEGGSGPVRSGRRQGEASLVRMPSEHKATGSRPTRQRWPSTTRLITGGRCPPDPGYLGQWEGEGAESWKVQKRDRLSHCAFCVF